MSDERIKIRCPNCRRAGKARAEHVDRRVSCKYCNHIFRVVPIVDPEPAPPASTAARKPGSSASGRQAARSRIEGLEEQLNKLRDDLFAQSAELPAFGWAEAQAADLRQQLAAAQEEARSAGALLVEADAARARVEKTLRDEAESLRGELAGLREQASEAVEAQAAREQTLLQEIAGLREQLDATVAELPPPGPGPLEDEARALREELGRARDAAEARDREHGEALETLRADHEHALAEARAHLGRAADEAGAAEAGRLEADSLRLAAEADRDRIREDLDGEARSLRAEAEAARRALDDHRADRERAEAAMRQVIEHQQDLLTQVRAELDEAGATREHRDRLAAELDEFRARLEGAERVASEATDRASADRERDRADHESEARGLREELAIVRAGVEDSEATREQLAQARARLEEAESARRELDEARERGERLAAEVGALRERLGEAEALRAKLGEAERREAGSRAELEALAAEVGTLRDQLDRARSGLAEAEAARVGRDGARLERDREAAELERARPKEAQRAPTDWGFAITVMDDHRQPARRAQASPEAEALRAKLGEAERREAGSRAELEALAAEVGTLRDQLDRARSGLAEAEAARVGRDGARLERDREAAELERLKEAQPDSTQWGFAITLMDDHRQLVRGAQASPEAEAARADPAEARERAARRESILADRALELALVRDEEVELDAGRIEAEREMAEERAGMNAEVEKLRRSLDQALDAAAAAGRAREELAGRIRQLEAAPAATPQTPTPTPTVEDPLAVEQARKQAVDEAVKGAWADFERRLAETQTRLRAANARAELLEAGAREAHDQVAAFQKGLELGEFSSFEEMAASMTSIRILADRGTPRLTLADAEARLSLARQLAVERKDRPLIDRIARMLEKVRDDLEAGNFTLAETLVRGAEIEVGLDPGGYSIQGLKIFRPSPSIVASLAALMPSFERVMQQGDLTSIRSTVGEIRTILGDQAGLPEIRRPGRVPEVKRPITPAEAARLFVGALEAEQWLMQAISTRRPLPDTTLTTYANLIEACADIHPAVEAHAPAKLELLGEIMRASYLMLARRQQPDGHFPFLDPRSKPSRLATVVDAMVARNPASVRDGWVVTADPFGAAQSENGNCGQALLKAGAVLKRPEWTQAALRAADWAAAQPCLPHFLANALSASLLARTYLDSGQARHLDALSARLTLGLLPGQVENGRWVDAVMAQTPNHITILQALQHAWEAVPADRGPLRDELKAGLDRAADSLLEECQALGVPAQGGALRVLIRHRDLTRPDLDPRLGPAILDSATVVQELCHDGGRPKLGVAPDLLAALARA